MSPFFVVGSDPDGWLVPFWRMNYFLGVSILFHSFLLSFLLAWCNPIHPPFASASSLPSSSPSTYASSFPLHVSEDADANRHLRVHSRVGVGDGESHSHSTMSLGTGSRTRQVSFAFFAFLVCEKCDYTTVIPGPWPCRHRRDMSCHD